MITIQGLLDLVRRKEYMKEEGLTVLDMLDRNAHALLERINSISYLLKLRNIPAVPSEPFKPEEEIRDAILNLMKLYPDRAVTFQIDNSAGCMYFFPKSTFLRILDLLLQNSFRFTRENLALQIVLRKNSLKIEDNSIGFNSKTYKDRLFRPYQRFDKNLSGPGLGLYLAKSEARKIGVRIILRSVIGSGTFISLKW
jgi:signal transduction histidine kinase